MEAPAPLLPRTPYPIADGGTSSFPTGPSAFVSTPASTATHRYGGIRGSYLSPYDGGRVTGDVRLPASSTTVEEFERMFSSADCRASGKAPSENSEVSQDTVTVTPAVRRIEKPKIVPIVPEGVSTFQLT
jgi:hypothetical protein